MRVQGFQESRVQVFFSKDLIGTSRHPIEHPNISDEVLTIFPFTGTPEPLTP